MISAYRLFPQVLVLCTAYGISFPLLSFALVEMGASTLLIGLIAAMPAVGWLIGTPLIPAILRKMSLPALTLCLLGAAALAWAGFWLVQSPPVWVGLRFVFGGAMGLFFRCVEYAITASAPPHARGRWLGIYNVMFLGGLILGSLLLPVLQNDMVQFGAVMAGLVAVLAAGVIWPIVPQILAPKAWGMAKLTAFVWAVPLSAMAVFTYGVYENLPAVMLPVYVLQQGVGEGPANAAVTISLLGALVGPIVGGIAADRIGARPMVAIAASLGAVGMMAVSVVDPVHKSTFLALLMVCGAAFSALYIAGLSYLTTKYHGEDLLHANMGFGTIYAIAAMVGPLYNARTMNIWENGGLFWGVAALAGLMVVVVALPLRRRA
jgi:MFS family permease